MTFEPIGMSAETLQEGFQRIYERFYSWRSIIQRVGRRIAPLVWAVNVIYNRRVGRWLEGLRSEPAG